MFSRIMGLLAGAALLSIAHSVSAQDDRLKEIVLPADDTITLQPGETRFFQFDEPIKNILAPGEAVEISPQSDRTISIRGGENPGVAVATLLANDGHVIRRMRIVVGGRLVKIYGAIKDNKESDSPFFAQICNEFGCDNIPQKGPVPKSVTVRTPTRDGGFVDKTY